MFGTLGAQEMVVIFLLALLLFGPKKLPEIGRTIGKALTEFRRASSDLKSTFEREMKTLEQENDSIKQAATQLQNDTYNYDYSSYDPAYETSYGTESYDASAATPSDVGASAPVGAESTSAGTSEVTMAQGTAPEAGDSADTSSPGDSGPAMDTSAPVSTEHKA
jgi:TatA/E family protein of Tat protein translocase